MEDFAITGWHYLKRSINIWADNIKLRYGSCPADSPYLWKHMTKYVQDMADAADGFRLDNTHSTPIHVCQYLL
jgi:glycogen debranching enzyme